MSEIRKQQEKVEQEIEKLEDMGGPTPGRFARFRDSAFTRFPTLFVLLSSFGLVATFYGFEKVIDGVDLFTEHPYAVLVTGIFTLIATGTLYKKLN